MPIYDPAQLLAARDYLLEHWTPEPAGTLVRLTKERIDFKTGTFVGDIQLAAVLPHYRHVGRMPLPF